MRSSRRALASGFVLLTTGCHSAFIEATVRNSTGKPVSLVELDYPSASFGTQTLAPEQDFHYRFKVLGSGDLKLIYTDTARTEHTEKGPHVDEGEEGTLLVTIRPGGIQWTPRLGVRR